MEPPCGAAGAAGAAGAESSSRRVGGSAARFSLARNPTRPWLACFMHGKELRWLVIFEREYEGLSAEVVHEHLLIRGDEDDAVV